MDNESVAAKRKRESLALVTSAAEKRAKADSELRAAMRFAQTTGGASYREIGKAADMPHTTVAYQLKGDTES